MRVYEGACVLHHIWVNTCSYCTEYKERWALAAFEDTARVLALFIIHVYTCAHVCAKTFVIVGTCGHVGAFFFCSGACVLHYTWVHACFYCGVYSKCWGLVSFDDIGVHN